MDHKLWPISQFIFPVSQHFAVKQQILLFNPNEIVRMPNKVHAGLLQLGTYTSLFTFTAADDGRTNGN